MDLPGLHGVRVMIQDCFADRVVQHRIVVEGFRFGFCFGQLLSQRIAFGGLLRLCRVRICGQGGRFPCRGLLRRCNVHAGTDPAQIVLKLPVGHQIVHVVPFDIHLRAVRTRISVGPDIGPILQLRADLIHRRPTGEGIARFRVFQSVQPGAQLVDLGRGQIHSDRVSVISRVKILCRDDRVGCRVISEADRIRQKADGQDDAGSNGQKNDPESRFFVVHHRSYTLLYPDLAEGERAGRNSAAVHTARDKGLHIVGPLPAA